MDGSSVIKLSKPVEAFNRTIKEVALKEPTGALFMRLGEPRIGVATADLFPQVTLVGAIGSQAQGWGTTPAMSKHIWSFGPGAMWPLLDFGAIDAQVDIADLAAHASDDGPASRDRSLSEPFT